MVINECYVRPLAQVVIARVGGVVIPDAEYPAAAFTFVGLADARIQERRETSETGYQLLLCNGARLDVEAYEGGIVVDVVSISDDDDPEYAS